MRVSSYTIASDTPQELLKTLDRVQFTLNSRIYPSKRKSVETVAQLREKYPSGEIFVHYDFVYIASRYMFLNYGTKRSIVNEIRSLMSSSEISGVVMHTDFPLRKELYSLVEKSEESVVQIVDSIYSKSLFDKAKIIDSVMNESTNEAILRYNLLGFITDLFYNFTEVHCPIYFENTTKSAYIDDMLKELILFVETWQSKYPYIGLCLDTEHAFADNGFLLENQILTDLTSKIKNLMFHLNPIPAEVDPGSKKDRHSETTLLECSRIPMKDYESVLNYLDSKNIPYIRECYLETILREQEQLKSWQSK